MTWTPPSLAPLALALPVPIEEQGTAAASEATLPGAHELESDSAFWALHDEVQILGKGSYGTVKLVRVKSNNNLVAVKAVTKGATPPEDGIDERQEAEALLLMRRHENANTAPARIGGRKARSSRQGSRLSLMELQEELRASAEGEPAEGKPAEGKSPTTVVGALGVPPSPTPARAASHRRSATLGAASSGLSSLRRKSGRNSDAMDVWQLQAALFGGGPTGTAERESHRGTADTAVLPPTPEPVAEEGEGGVTVADGAADEGSSDTVRLLDVYESPGTLFLVMRAELGGDLATRLSALPGGRCEEAEARTHATALLRAVAGMHEQGIVHRDIKPSNVLLSQEGEGRLGDFGLATQLPKAGAASAAGGEVGAPALLTAVCGTHNNMAPEMVRCGHGEAAGYGTPSDLWQMGLLIFELLCGTHPIARETEIETLAAILAADYAFPPDVRLSDEARDLVRRLLVSDPAVRLTAAECLRHPWIVQHSRAPNRCTRNSLMCEK